MIGMNDGRRRHRTISWRPRADFFSADRSRCPGPQTSSSGASSRRWQTGTWLQALQSRPPARRGGRHRRREITGLPGACRPLRRRRTAAKAIHLDPHDQPAGTADPQGHPDPAEGSRPSRSGAALLKGRGNYLCMSRLRRAMRNKGDLFTSSEQDDLKMLWDWAHETEDGSRSDHGYPRHPPRGSGHQVCSESLACSPRICGKEPLCFFQAAKAQGAWRQTWW